MSGSTERLEAALSMADGEGARLIDSLIGEMGPSAATQEITVGDGHVFTVRLIADRAEMVALRNRTRRFVEGARANLPPNPEVRALFETDDDTKQKAYMLADMIVSPKLDVVDLLKLAKKACLAFEELYMKWGAAYAGVLPELEATELASAKNALSGPATGIG